MKERHRIKVWKDNHIKQIECGEGESLLDAMRRQGIPYYSDCGGRGSCGKCKVRIRSGKADPGPEDNKKISEKERSEGYRLACRVYPKAELDIELAEYGEGLEVITDVKIPQYVTANQSMEESYAVAIDLGTTTLAFQAVNCQTGEIMASYSLMNPQRRLGADVVSRMKASSDGSRKELKQLIHEALIEGIDNLRKIASLPGAKLRHISIAGNTTMVHLLMGYSCETLGSYPFQPVHIGKLEESYTEFFREELERRRSREVTNECDLPVERKVTVLPGISAFVGSDIVAGLTLCGFDKRKEISLFLDLGTNGELAIGNRDRLLVTSTAAGPAFEGGNISIGMGSVPGAVSKLFIEDGILRLETIGGQKPIGICGTGVIELCSELLKNGIMDGTGLLREDYFDAGFPIAPKDGEQLRFLQRDIRELQLAKAAIRAGIELLIRRYGVTYENIDRVYLAGGFGFVLPVEKAVHIGLLPEELKDKIVAVGNSSLAGAVRYTLDPEFPARTEKLAAMAQEIHIANEEEFQEQYIRYMNFIPDEEE
jgi:uncharacterized 2Fe-2S/4Fe-4S cluster protein (DUF4445 family)